MKKSSNPVFKAAVNQQYNTEGKESFYTSSSSEVATAQGVFTKTLSAVVVFVGSMVLAMTVFPSIMFFFSSLPGILITIAISFYIAFAVAKRPESAKKVLYGYAVLQGFYLSGLVYALNYYTGTNIGLQAGVIVIAIFFSMLMVYRMYPEFYSKIAPFIAVATMAAFGIITVALIGSIFGLGFQFGSDFDLILTVFLTVVASLSYLRDFKMVDIVVEQNSPKEYEYVAAFGLLVTTIWLYVEVLRLIAILSSRRD